MTLAGLLVAPLAQAAPHPTPAPADPTGAAPCQIPNRTGTTYYVAADGDDTNPGTSEDQPFKTLAPVNEKTLGPGDSVLLKRGDVFNDQFLHPTGSGSAEQPIIISDYGDPNQPLPVINTNGAGVWYQDFNKQLDNVKHKLKGDVSTSILLYDVAYVEVSNLEITNRRMPGTPGNYNDRDAMNRTGVAVIAQDAGTINHVVLKDLYVHDVHGNVYDKHMANGGIYFLVHYPHNEAATGISRFNDVQVLNNRVENVNRWGIGVGYTAYHGQFNSAQLADGVMAKYGQGNVVIRGNYVKGAGGDSITTFYADRPLIEYNVSDEGSRQINTTDYSATDFGRVAAAIWPWKSKNAVFQYNEVFNTLNSAQGNGDGQAWDADWGDGTLYQYNYSHGNTGGTVMFCGVNAVNSTFRFNISQNDLAGLIDLPDNVPDAHVYNNTFYVAPDVPVLGKHQVRGNGTMENNIFYYTGNTPGTGNWNAGSGTKAYDNNLYYNWANLPNNEANPIQVAAGEQVMANPGTGPTSPLASGKTHRQPGTNDTTAFDGYRLITDSPAANVGKVITDNNGYALEHDFFGEPLSGAPDVGAAAIEGDGPPSSDNRVVSTIYMVNAKGINVPQTPGNQTTVAEVMSNIEIPLGATMEIVDNGGQAVAHDSTLSDGMSVVITAENGDKNTIGLVLENSYQWVRDYVNRQQGNVWFGQNKPADGPWQNITDYDPTWPNWAVDTWFGPGIDYSSHSLPAPEDRDKIPGLLSDSPHLPDSTSMAFRAPKTGYITFEVKDGEPYLRHAGNSGGTVTLSLEKNDEVIQSVTLAESLTQATDWANYLLANPIKVHVGDMIRVVAHSNDNPSKASLHVSPMINYVDKQDPDANTAPTLTVTATKEVSKGSDFDLLTLVESASDAEDGDLTGQVKVANDGGFNPHKPGDYVVTYVVVDSYGAAATAIATVTVTEEDTSSPWAPINTVPTLEVTEQTTIEQGAAFDPMSLVVSASDAEDGDLTEQVTLADDGGFDVNTPGEYSLKFKVTDSAGASCIATAKVTVTAGDTSTPWEPVNTVPTLEVTEQATIEQGAAFDPMSLVVAASDAEDGDLTDQVVLLDDGAFDVNTPGEYTLTFKVTDSQGAVFSAVATVTVTAKDDTTTPWEPINQVPTMELTESVSIEQGAAFDPMSLVVSATDAEDGDLTDQVVLLDDGGFDVNTPGEYALTFKVTDTQGASFSAVASVTVTAKDDPTQPDKPAPDKPSDPTTPGKPGKPGKPGGMPATGSSAAAALTVAAGLALSGGVVLALRRRYQG